MCYRKDLCFLTPKFDYIIYIIKETKDLISMLFEELEGSLQAHEKKNQEKTRRAIGVGSQNQGYTKN